MQSVDDLREFGGDVFFRDTHGAQPVDPVEDGGVEGLSVFLGFEGREEWD